MQYDSIKLLLMGPLVDTKGPVIAGGAVVLFDELLKELKKNEIQYEVIDTNRRNYSNFFMAYLSILTRLLFRQSVHTHIALHSSNDYMMLGLMNIIIAKLFKKRTSLRKFGAEAAQVYKESRGLKKYLLHTIFTRTDVLFFETKYLTDFFSKMNKHTYWFPNVRNRLLEPVMPRAYEKRFVFIGQIIYEKGIDELVEACKRLDDSFTIDIYGPTLESKYTHEYFQRHGASYKGALKPTDVLKTLNTYDVVLLPSYKEGYPGIVLEAFSLGMPVITTALPAIKEIIRPLETGILIEPRSVDDLVDAIHHFDFTNYVEMSKNAYSKFNDFESGLQTKKYLERV